MLLLCFDLNGAYVVFFFPPGKLVFFADLVFLGKVFRERTWDSELGVVGRFFGPEKPLFSQPESGNRKFSPV